MGHDSEPTGEDGSHHGHIGAMPQQPPIAQFGVGLEPVSLSGGDRKWIDVPCEGSDVPSLGLHGSMAYNQPGGNWSGLLNQLSKGADK